MPEPDERCQDTGDREATQVIVCLSRKIVVLASCVVAW